MSSRDVVKASFRASPSIESNPRAVAGLPAFDRLLTSGSDFRLRLDRGNGLNAYGCQPFPRPGEISFSSSTASTISPRAYSAALSTYNTLCGAGALEREGGLAELATTTKEQLKALFDVNDGEVEVVLSPSGTDAELQALFLARQSLAGPITAIVVAADETGSGVAPAAAGRHFSGISSAGRAVIRGESLRGLGANVASVSVKARNTSGDARPVAEIDDEVRRCAADAVSAGSGIVLHLMDHSKLGSRCPSLECVQDICARWGNAVRVVVDACQARLGRVRMRRYLDLGFMVIVTGSKFFTGPPLSGALFVPAQLWPEAADAEALAGLSDYTDRDDWPEHWTALREGLPRCANVGKLLRWSAALEEIRSYVAVPEMFRNICVAEFNALVSRMLAEFPDLRLLPPPEWMGDTNSDDGEFGARTIFPFLIINQGSPLTLAESRIVYEALNRDLSPILPSKSNREDAAVLVRPCHVGQPVGISDRQGREIGAIRISASARLVSESWRHSEPGGAIEEMRAMMGRVRIVLEKIQRITSHFDEVCRVAS